jgi:Cof subfamily protein (haloacid dehalogenase superfamily)
VVRHDYTISLRTIAAISAAHEAGIEIFYVTGRPPRWMAEIKEAFGIGKAICGNGAMLYDLENEKVVEEWLVPVETQFAITKALRIAIPNVSFAVEIDGTFHREKIYIPKWDAGLDNVGVDVAEDAMTAPALKILARCSDGSLSSDEMLAIATPALEGIANVTHSNATDSLLEVSALGVSKGATLAKMAARAGIDAEDVVAFGDNPNDFSMLEYAGRSWAMKDGHPDGYKHAKFVAPPHDQDGVAQIIEQLIELPF